jgi:NitT/TauT family transport system permease protein
MTQATAEASATAPLVDTFELQIARRRRTERIARWIMPVVSLGLLIGLWQWLVVAYDMKPYILPRPLLVAETLVNDWSSLLPSLLNTLETTFKALIVAVIGGVGLAVMFAQSKWLEMIFSPYAVILQVTPIVVVAPYITIYIDDIGTQLLVCAWIVAFFPVLSNTTLGLNSADHNLRNLFELYGATRWQTLRYLKLPGALPYFLGGLRIAGGLALIGAVVAEFVVGASGKGSGLAYRILEAAYRLNIARMFAATILISITGILIFLATNWLTWALLHRWHDSAVKREN